MVSSEAYVQYDVRLMHIVTDVYYLMYISDNKIQYALLCILSVGIPT